MKYIYKGMSAPELAGSSACAVFLSWHDKVRPIHGSQVSITSMAQLTEAAGTGCIVRAMTGPRKYLTGTAFLLGIRELENEDQESHFQRVQASR